VPSARALGLAALLAALGLAAATPAPAPAANTIGGPLVTTTYDTTPSSPVPTDPNALSIPERLDEPPAQHARSADDVIAVADALPDVRRARRRHPGSYPTAYEKGADRWQVSYFAPGRDRVEIAQVTIADATGAVLEHYTGYKVAWTMARGYPGAFGRRVNEPWIWIPLAVLFVVPFVDPRRPWRWLHADLLALSLFSVSIAFFNHAQIGTSVPLAYPPLAYLLVRMLALALARDRRGGGPDGRLRLLVPVSWLAVALVFLVGFRIGLNLTSSNVIDVGYSGVIGADRIVHGDRLYGNFPADDEHGDTYGPLAYEAYVPFERALGWSGRWDDLPAAHAAAIAFDLLTIALLFLVGRRVRGPDLGIALAYGWAAYPFTVFASNTNTNDALVTVTVLLALLAAGRPLWRGAAAGAAALTKLAPLALAPVLATHRLGPGRRGRTLACFAVGFAAALALLAGPILLGEDLGTVYDRTVGYQADRGSPFSIWGLYGWTGARRAMEVLAVALAVGLAIVPRRRDLAGLAAACAAVLIAVQLSLSYWFYLYLVWFFPLVLIAGLGREARRS
jgi:hypothetical protein